MEMSNTSANEVTLAELLEVVWKQKLYIGGITVIAAVVSVILSLQLPNMYYSEAVLTPAQSSEMPNLSGQLGGLASLAGLSLGADQGNRTAVALETLKSRKFITGFIKKHQIAMPLIAATEWDNTADKLVIDSTLYSAERNEWVREVSYPYTQVPSDWELYDAFMKIMSIEQDPVSGVIKVGIEFLSPYLAAQWVENLVKDINQEMRSRDKEQAVKSIEYLTKEIENIAVASTREVFFSLVEEQLKTKMLAEVTPDYAFTVIDPPYASELKSAPKRSFIVLIVTFLAAFIATVLFSVIALSRQKNIA